MTDARSASVPTTANAPGAGAWRTGAFVLLAAAVAAIVGASMRTRGAVDAWALLHWAAKPVASAVVLQLAWRHAGRVDARLQRALVLGLAFSLLGDVLLMLPPAWFIGGLLAFLVAHACYLRAFSIDTPLLSSPAALAALLAFGAGVLFFLWDGLAPALKLPVVAYLLVLVVMAAQAIARDRRLRATTTRAAAVGAVLFVASDTLLAIDRFRSPIPLAPLWVLGTYWAAQWGIAQSVRGGIPQSVRGPVAAGPVQPPGP